MPRRYPAEFRRKVPDLVEAGRAEAEWRAARRVGVGLPRLAAAAVGAFDARGEVVMAVQQERLNPQGFFVIEKYLDAG